MDYHTRSLEEGATEEDLPELPLRISKYVALFGASDIRAWLLMISFSKDSSMLKRGVARALVLNTSQLMSKAKTYFVSRVIGTSMILEALIMCFQ